MGISITRLKGDLFGSVTAAVVALPLALAFGVSSGAGPLSGLYAAIFAGFLAAVFGGTRAQITGPTGPMTVVMALVITHFNSMNNPSAAFAVVILAGIFQIGFGVLRLGRYIKLVPQPVISGFMSGIGFIIIIMQLAALTGHVFDDGGIILKLTAVPGMIAAVNFSALMLGAVCLGIMLFTPKKLAVYAPPPLMAVIIGTVLGTFLLKEAPVIGELPSGLPEFVLPQISLSDLSYIVRFALVLAFLGSIDSLLTSLVLNSMSRTHHEPNRELIGQGLGNMAAGFFSALPSAGATMRSLVNVRAGGTSRLSGSLHSLILFLVVIEFSDLASHIPLAVLAGILVKIGIDIIDWGYLKRIHRAPPAGVVIMLTTLFTTVFVDLITAVAVGFVMASVLFVARMADAQMSSARFAFGSEHVNDLSQEETDILDNAGGRIVLFHVEGPLSFGSARDIAKLLQSDLEKDFLLIDLSDVPFVDSSACNALMEVIVRLNEIGDIVILFGARQKVINTFAKTGILEVLDNDCLVDTRLKALHTAQKMINSYG